MILALLTGVAAFGLWQVIRAGSPPAAPAHAAEGPAASIPPAPPPIPGTRPVATARGLTLYLPLAHPVAVAYHEASLPGSLVLTPLGRCVRDANRTRFPRPEPTFGPDYIVMSSRGRTYAATTALDVALRAGQTPLAPVTGTVGAVKPYRLYGRYPDVRLSIRPAGQGGLRVIVLHLARVLVRPGQEVVAGVTPLGSPRRFPFSSQINDYVGPGIPHVHIEVKRVPSPGQT